MAYAIKFTCKELTGDTVHNIDIDDSSLGDTWDVFTFGEIPTELKAIECECTHDVNVWWDENDDGINELMMSVYPLINDPESADQVPQTDHSNPIRCEIVEVSGGEEKFSKEGQEYFYYVDEEEWEYCDECGNEFNSSDLRSYKYEPSRRVCDDCHDQLMREDEE